MPRMVFLSLLIFFTSCVESPSNQQKVIRSVQPIESFVNIINQKSIEKKSDIDFNDDKSVINQDYPVELWLFKNNKYFYELPNLGDGIGTWTYENGQLLLSNNHHIKTIDLNIEMKYSLYFSNDESLYIEFSDRFGFKNIEIVLKD